MQIVSALSLIIAVIFSSHAKADDSESHSNLEAALKYPSCNKQDLREAIAGLGKIRGDVQGYYQETRILAIRVQQALENDRTVRCSVKEIGEKKAFAIAYEGSVATFQIVMNSWGLHIYNFKSRSLAESR